MGCYPFGKLVSKAFWMCTGKEKRSSRKVKLSPQLSYIYSNPRSVAKSVNFSNQAPIVIIPPDPITTVTLPRSHPSLVTPTQQTTITTSAATPTKLENVVEAVRSPPTSPTQKERVQVQRNPPHCYVMSPLPRCEERPRRREYFGREYYYYPTPIREGIYNIGIDPSRLTAIFSEENPNACTIV